MEVTGSTDPQQLIVSWSRAKTSMLEMIHNLVGLDLRSYPFAKMFSGPSAIGVTISDSNMAFLPVPFTFYPLNLTTSITEGLSFIVLFQLPALCGYDPFCNFFRLILGNSPAEFRVYDIKGTAMKIAYKVPHGISFAGFRLYNVEAGVQTGQSDAPKFGLMKAELDIPTEDGDKLHFVGKLFIDPLQIADAELWMYGMWQRAFKIPFLSIGNILARIKAPISCPSCISAFSLGGELWLGSNCNGTGAPKCIKGAAYVAVNDLDPNDQWAYATVNQASYSKLIRALGIDVAGLEMLDVTSYRNCEFSYSKKTRTLPSGMVPNAKRIRAGIVFKGDVTLLWFYNVHFDMTVYTTLGYVTYVKAFITATRVDFGLVKFTSASDQSKGPLFYLEAGLLPPKYGFTMDGELSIPTLSTRRRVIATIDRNGFKGTLTTTIFGFGCKYQLTAAFVNVLNPKTLRSFRIVGTFSSDLGIGSKVAQVLTDIRDRTNRALSSAVNTLDAAEKKLKNLITSKEAFEAVYKQKKSAFEVADKALATAQDVVNKLCKIRNCPSVTLKVPDVGVCKRCACGIKYPCGWWSWCCKTVCIYYPCKVGLKTVWVPEPVCTAANVACLPLRVAAFTTLSAATKALRLAEDALKAAIASLRQAVKLVMDQQILTRAARLAESSVRFVFDSVASVVNNLRFAIHKIWFDVYLHAITAGQITTGIEATVFATRQTFSFTINLRNTAETAKLIARKFFPKVFADFDKMFG